MEFYSRVLLTTIEKIHLINMQLEIFYKIAKDIDRHKTLELKVMESIPKYIFNNIYMQIDLLESHKMTLTAIKRDIQSQIEEQQT